MDSHKKKQMLKEWISLYVNEYVVDIAIEGQRVTKTIIGESIAKHCSKINDSDDYIYLLCIYNSDELIPVYIGKSNNPLNRWKSHINKWFEGKGSYSYWKNLLLTENDMAKHSIKLLIIPENAIENSPIPNFPKTVGSVEYQLISLVSDAYSNTLLNKEGNRR